MASTEALEGMSKLMSHSTSNNFFSTSTSDLIDSDSLIAGVDGGGAGLALRAVGVDKAGLDTEDTGVSLFEIDPLDSEIQEMRASFK